ncbi:MAG: hypothetical protein FJ128_02780 [Deltaproteobacteria bacterium]|nr:hypothetical protein [Deltaproteobacteria bacterium]
MNRSVGKLRAGGLKVQEGGAAVVSLFPAGSPGLGPTVCGPLARQQLNLSLLAHLGGAEDRGHASIFCTSREDGPQSYALLSTLHQGAAAFRLLAGTCIISLFPHDRRPDLMGAFCLSLSRAGVMLRGLASSPAAIAAVISLRAKQKAIAALFEDFEFRAYRSPEEFAVVLHPPEAAVREVVASYQEKAPRIYTLVQQDDLDLWEVAVSSRAALREVGDWLRRLGEDGGRLPFLVAVPQPPDRLRLVFCLSDEGSRTLLRLGGGREAGLNPRRRGPVAAFFTHGPHFGDRYGIAQVLAAALEEAGAPLLALSCAVSSLSVVVPQSLAAAARRALQGAFGAPHGD